MMAVWDRDKTWNLIEDLRCTPCLWDEQCPDYKSRTTKNDAYERLSVVYGVRASEVEKKIQALKNQLRREHRKPEKCKRSEWFGYQSLMFLLQQYETRKSLKSVDHGSLKLENEDNQANVDCVETSSDDELAADDESVPEDSTQSDIDPTTSSNVTSIKKTNFSAQPSHPPPKKIKTLVDNSNIQKTLETVSNIVTERDQFAVYGEHIANKLRYSGKSKIEIAIAQHQIDNVCFKLIMGSFGQQRPFQNDQDHVQQDYILPIETDYAATNSPSISSHYTPQGSPDASSNSLH